MKLRPYIRFLVIIVTFLIYVLNGRCWDKRELAPQFLATVLFSLFKWFQRASCTFDLCMPYLHCPCIWLPSKVMPLFKFCYISAQIQTLWCQESLCGHYLCHQIEQFTSKGRERDVQTREWARLRSRRTPSGWCKAPTGKEFTVYEGCHGWGIKCVFALMHAVGPCLAETVK